jgi:hypothetical protein
MYFVLLGTGIACIAATIPAFAGIPQALSVKQRYVGIITAWLLLIAGYATGYGLAQ